MEVITALIAAVYAGGMVGTWHIKTEEGVELDNVTLAQTGDFMPWWQTGPMIIWTLIIGLLWPLYWVGRALYAPAERLLLPPGESL